MPHLSDCLGSCEIQELLSLSSVQETTHSIRIFEQLKEYGHEVIVAKVIELHAYKSTTQHRIVLPAR